MASKACPDSDSACGKVEIIKSPMDRDHKETYWNKKEKLKWMLTFFVGNILLYSARSVMSIGVPAMSKELGWSKVVSGMALSAFFCGYLCTNMIGGHFADKLGGEVVICYVGIGWAFLTTTLPFIARSHFLISSPTVAVILSRFLTGLSQGVFYPSISAIMAQRIMITERGSFSGITTSGANIGSAATGLFGSLILEKYDWSVMFIAVGSLSILWISWLRYLISFRKPTAKNDIKNKQPNNHNIIPFRKLLSTRAFWGLYIGYFMASYCFLVMLSWTPVYFHDNFPESKGWMFNTVPWFVAFCFSISVGYFQKIITRSGVSLTVNRKIFCSFQLLGYALCSLYMLFVDSFSQALIIVSLTISSNAFSNCCLAINAQDLMPAHAGILHGLLNGSGALAGVIGVYLTGHILKLTGSWTVVFLLNSILTFIGWLCYMLLGSGEQVI